MQVSSDHSNRKGRHDDITAIGIGRPKNVFQVHGANECGKTVLRKKLRREQVTAFIAHLPTWPIGMEACGSAHHWACKLQALGHTVWLMTASIQRQRCITAPSTIQTIAKLLQTIRTRTGLSWTQV